MKRFLILLVATICLTGCSVLRNTSKTHFLELRVFQTLSSHEALAWTEDYDVVKIVMPGELLYDGKTYIGVFVLVDTFTYTTRQDIQKTVPVYMKRSDYRKMTAAQ